MRTWIVVFVFAIAATAGWAIIAEGFGWKESLLYAISRVKIWRFVRRKIVTRIYRVVKRATVELAGRGIELLDRIVNPELNS